MSVRPATVDDLAEVARIHKASFANSDGLLARYSVSLLAAFYKPFLGRTVFLVATSNRGIDGFVMGAESDALRACKREFILKNLVRCALETAIRPHFWRVVFEAVKGVFVPKKKEAAAAPEGMHMLSIAVDPEVSGKGTGKALVEAFDDEVRQDYSSYRLTVLKDNARAIRFYERLGFVIIEEQRRSLALEKALVKYSARSA